MCVHMYIISIFNTTAASEPPNFNPVYIQIAGTRVYIHHIRNYTYQMCAWIRVYIYTCLYIHIYTHPMNTHIYT